MATQHVPTFMNYPDEYKGSLLNEAFFDLIKKIQPDVWMYGRTHGNVYDFTIGKTNLGTNKQGNVSRNEHDLFGSGKFYVF